MSLPAESHPPLIRFGDFELDPSTGELHHRGGLTALQEQPFQLLMALLERPGRLVTREELRKRLWPNGTFVDYELSLNKTVNRLREVLGDSAAKPNIDRDFRVRIFRGNDAGAIDR